MVPLAFVSKLIICDLSDLIGYILYSAYEIFPRFNMIQCCMFRFKVGVAYHLIINPSLSGISIVAC